MDHKKLIGARIKALREDCELSAETLAEKLGVPAEFLNRVEEGTAEVSVSVLHQIGRICGVDLTTLLTGENRYAGGKRRRRTSPRGICVSIARRQFCRA